MTIRAYSFLMLVATLLAWTVWVFVLMSVDPFVTNWIGFVLFYFSLFLALMGTSVMIGFVLRVVIMRKEIEAGLIKDAFRQSFLFSILVIASLMLLSRDLFSWLNLCFLVASLSVFEYFWLSFGKK